MRAGTRRRHTEDEEESAFVSMTDMTVSFLFIVMVLLAFFASQFDDAQEKVPKTWLDQAIQERDAALAEAVRLSEALEAAQTQIAVLKRQVANLERDLEDAKQEIADLLEEIARLEERLRRLEIRDPLEAYISASAAERRKILEQLRDELKISFPDLAVVISEESDALRFEGDGLFDRGQSVLRMDRRAIVDIIAERLEQILPCYSLGSRARWSDKCNSGLAVIEALQIEGHTDADGSAFNNMVLSTARANSTFAAMTDREPGLIDHLNFRNQPVISVAGYGEMRPVVPNDNVADKATNRRMDLRIIMYVPRQTEEIERIRDRLSAGLSGEQP